MKFLIDLIHVLDEMQQIKNAVARDQMQLSLNKDTDSSEKDMWRRNATKSNTQNESPPKIRKSSNLTALK